MKEKTKGSDLWLTKRMNTMMVTLFLILITNLVLMSTYTELRKGTTDILSVSENISRIVHVRRDVGVDVTYLEDKAADLCYGVVSIPMPDNNTITHSMINVPCETIPGWKKN